MILDNFLQLSGSWSNGTWTGQTVTGTGSVLSTNTVDLGTARDVGEGSDLYMHVGVVTAFTGLTSLEMQVIVADDAGLTTNVTVVGTTGAIAVASLTLGARFVAQVNPQVRSLGRRYLGARYVITGTGTAGALVSDIGIDVQDGQKFYANGFAVL